MARPRHEQPTPAELEILKILWDRDRPGVGARRPRGCES